MQEKISKNPSENPRDLASDFARLAGAIKAWGKESGFQEIRIADAKADMTQAEYGLKQWLDKGYQGEMDYMVKHGIRRTRPAELVSGTLRVISVRMNYMPVAEDGWEVIYNGHKAFVPLCAWAITTKCCVCVCKNLLTESQRKWNTSTTAYSRIAPRHRSGVGKKI